MEQLPARQLDTNIGLGVGVHGCSLEGASEEWDCCSRVPTKFVYSMLLVELAGRSCKRVVQSRLSYQGNGNQHLVKWNKKLRVCGISK